MARWALATRDGDLVGGDFPTWPSDLLGRAGTLGLADRRGASTRPVPGCKMLYREVVPQGAARRFGDRQPRLGDDPGGHWRRRRAPADAPGVRRRASYGRRRRCLRGPFVGPRDHRSPALVGRHRTSPRPRATSSGSRTSSPMTRRLAAVEEILGGARAAGRGVAKPLDRRRPARPDRELLLYLASRSPACPTPTALYPGDRGAAAG